MALLDGLERLITEHGSAAILKERIELANDKYAALEGKYNDVLSRNRDLEVDLERLRTSLQKADKEIAALRVASNASINSVLDEIQEKILVFLGNNDGSDENQIASSVDVSAVSLTFHIVELESQRLVSRIFSMATIGRARPTTIHLTQEGRRYLVTHGLQ